MGRQASSKTVKEFQARGLLRIRIRNWKVRDQGSISLSFTVFLCLATGLVTFVLCHQTPNKKQLREKRLSRLPAEGCSPPWCKGLAAGT